MKMKTNSLNTLLLILASSLSICISALAADRSEATDKKDNTAINARDDTKHANTADQQMLGNQDVEVIAAIRREIVANDKLSTYGKNVKIVQEKGKVLLRGPVHSEDEKKWIGQAAKKAAPNIAIINELEITKE
jgi:osmotically-inducible protein OsmY